MTGVSTSLRMFDMMTRPLQQVTQAMNLTISVMDDLSNSANRDIRLTRNLEGARAAIRNAEIGLRQMSSETERARNAQERMNNTLRNGSKDTDSLTKKIKGLVGAYVGLQTAKKGSELTVGGAMEQQKMRDMFIARTGDFEIGTAMFDKFKSDALNAGQDVNKALQGTLSFFSATQNTDHLTKLNNLANRLSAFDSAGNGIEGAAFSLKEALSGDIVSLAERFNMSKADIRAFNIDELGKSGDIEGFLTAFDLLLEKQRMGQEAFETMMKSPIKQLEIFRNNIKSSFADAGKGALSAFLPVIIMLNTAFQEGKFDGFFNGLNIGLSIVATLISWVVKSAMFLGDTISNNWGIIEPILWGIIGALVVYNSGMLISMANTAKDLVLKGLHTLASWGETAAIIALTIAQDGLNVALAACPLTWIIYAIIALIAIFYAAVAAVNHFAGTSYSATGMIAGAFAVMGAFIWNLFLGLFELILGVINALVNSFIRFANFIGNVFTNPISSVIYAFQSMGDNILMVLQKIASAMDFVFGSNMESTVASWKSGLKGMADKAVEKYAPNENYQRIMNELDLSAGSFGLNRIEYGKAYSSGHDWGKGIADKFDISKLGGSLGQDLPNRDDLLNNWNAQQGNTLGGLDELDGNGKDANKKLKGINDKLEVSNEHLAMMRDMAEQEAVKNFVTLAPNVIVTHTGDINNGYDVDTIVGRIEEKIDVEIAAGAREVFHLG